MGQCGEGGRAGHVLCWLHGVADARGEDGRGGGGEEGKISLFKHF